MTRARRKAVSVVACAGVALGAAIWVRASAPQGQVREFSVDGRSYAFSPNRLEVQKDDLVKISFSAHEMAHSFTIDEYRIAKRAGAGQSVTFEFRADRPGEFTYYCNMRQDERCSEMRGRLIVR